MERERRREVFYIKRDLWKPLSPSSNIDLIWKINTEIRYSQRNPGHWIVLGIIDNLVLE